MLRNKQIFDIADKCDEGQEGNEFLVAFAYAIESAACAKRDARIAKLEQLRSEDLSHALDLAAEIERLARELAEARKDAERYLRLKQDRPVLLLTGFFGNGCVNRTIEEVDAAIDAAIKEQT